MFGHFGIEISEDERKAIKHADNVALAWEKRHVMGPGPRDHRWEWLPEPIANARVRCAPPPIAKDLFLNECQWIGVVDGGGS